MKKISNLLTLWLQIFLFCDSAADIRFQDSQSKGILYYISLSENFRSQSRGSGASAPEAFAKTPTVGYVLKGHINNLFSYSYPNYHTYHWAMHRQISFIQK